MGLVEVAAEHLVDAWQQGGAVNLLQPPSRCTVGVSMGQESDSRSTVTYKRPWLMMIPEDCIRAVVLTKALATADFALLLPPFFASLFASFLAAFASAAASSSVFFFLVNEPRYNPIRSRIVMSTTHTLAMGRKIVRTRCRKPSSPNVRMSDATPFAAGPESGMPMPRPSNPGCSALSVSPIYWVRLY